MENAKEGCQGEKENEENPNLDTNAEVGLNFTSPQSSRTPFTSLSQVDSDLALARALQEQERAYMMLRMNGEASEYDSSDSGSYVFEEEVDYTREDGDADSDDEEDVFDMHTHAAAANQESNIDPSAFDSDEAYARALQDAEEREVAARLMALTGINDWEADDSEDHGSNSQMELLNLRGSPMEGYTKLPTGDLSHVNVYQADLFLFKFLQDTWQEVDPDELSYEELLALGEVVGTESRGLSADTIASLPSANYKAQTTQDGSSDQCVICRLDYEEGDALIVLSCKHLYHSGCINNWLQINKVCPVCSTEVSTSENRHG